MIGKRTPALLAAAIAAMLTLTIGAATLAHAQAAGCSVSYTVPNQWQSGFTATVSVTNLGAPVNGWRLTWSYTAGQRVVQGWNATFPLTGPQVEARNADWNAPIGSGGSVSFGFNGSWNNQSNPAPTNFALNGTPCNGSTQPPTSPPPTTSPPPQPGGTLPSSFQWSSSGPLAGPQQVDPSRTFVSVKDFSVVRHNNRWLIYATTASTAGGWSLVYYSFADWPQAASAQQTQLDRASAIGPGYRAAPQLFFFAPQNLWYLVYQSAPPTYSTTTDPTNPGSWSAPRTFIAQEPPIVTQNKGPGQWIDFWVICDTANCYLFFSDDNGHIYRAQTTMANFPNGFGNTQIVLSDSRFALFEATNVYRVQGQNQYLLIQEAIGSNGRRWFRSYTAGSLTRNWTPLANTESNPFARSNNVTFPGGAWTQDISHGELVRAGNDQTLTINPCDLQYVYQGMNPSASGEYSQLPWRMGLLTQTNSTC
jgi:endo-1,4-beta-xylanase